MQVNRIQSNNYGNQPNFGMLKFDKSAIPILKTLTADELTQVVKLKKEAAKTKRWNLTISSVSDRKFYAKYKDSRGLEPEHHVSLDSYRLNNDTVYVHSYTCDENVHDKLRFPTAERASEVYDSMRTEYYKLSPIEQIKKFVNTLRYLDESYEYMAKNPITQKAEQVNSSKVVATVGTKPIVQKISKKLSIIQRIKNAWQALKGN